MDCLFCKIAKKEVPADIVYEKGALMVFKDIRPSAPVHLLVVPKTHVVSVMELTDAHREMVADMVLIAKRIAAEQGLKGYKLVFNVGREGGQLVDHIHL